MSTSLKEQDNFSILEKKNNKQFEKIGWYQMLSFWNKDTRKLWEKNKIIDNLIYNRDYSTLFELYKNDYGFSEKQIIKMRKSIDKALIDRNYPDKPGLFNMMQKYEIEIVPKHYYHYIVSNSFQENIEQYYQYDLQEPIVEYLINVLLKDKKFKKQLHDFIVDDIQYKPTGFEHGMNWAANRNCYYEPINFSYIFDGMTKNQLNKIIKTKIGNESVIKEYQVLLNQAPIDNEVMDQLGINTKLLVEKAQKEVFLSEDGLSIEVKDKIKLISVEVEKIQKNDNVSYEETVIKLSEEVLPNIIKKYLSIDEEYRHSLRNVEGKLPIELLMESLDNIFIQVKDMNKKLNEEKITGLSVENRKLKR